MDSSQNHSKSPTHEGPSRETLDPIVSYLKGFTYQWPWSDRCEDLENYRPGGYHTVHIGDLFSDERYRVLHKLGGGGSSTVWMCRDTQTGKLVALKILMADESSRDCPELKVQERLEIKYPKAATSPLLALPKDHFWVDGPNGHHLCLVMPLLGPRILEGLWRMPDRQVLSPKIAYQVAQALELVHKSGLCHGDFHPMNILLKIKELDDLDDESLLQMLGWPKCESIVLQDGSSPGRNAPAYVVEYLNFDPSLYKNEICLIDFGTSIPIGTPSLCERVPLLPYISPEFLLQRNPGQHSDLWALGCMTFVIITGEETFPCCTRYPSELVPQWVQLLGRMPDDLWGMWEHRSRFYDEEGKPVSEDDEYILYMTEKKTWDQIISESITSDDGTPNNNSTLGDSSVDRALFTDLISKLVQYDTGARGSVTEVLEHDYWKVDRGIKNVKKRKRTSSVGDVDAGTATSTSKVDGEIKDVKKPKRASSIADIDDGTPSTPKEDGEDKGVEEPGQASGIADVDDGTPSTPKEDGEDKGVEEPGQASGIANVDDDTPSTPKEDGEDKGVEEPGQASAIADVDDDTASSMTKVDTQ
ncbi:kinase-like protein [Aaosphaeria arxii CBS 175.79]|uniref:Kinase-like protein n=1 Tax=Aaosphaeria arxii CBS 175.79 TaxID=1450172 RepID=A0A6A5XCK7_9PLEO|nr:kinase-like protein [Aaosphaeria arxii CBS 175.79]KAF2010649.1 kinase-like protein [Aaosphaeria arxii CBS 175.79]